MGSKWPDPIFVEQAGRTHLSLIAAIAPNGQIYVAGQDQSFTSEDIVWFLTKLCRRYRKRDMILIWDGAAIHRNEIVKAFLKEHPGRFYLERLPAYSPQLNPVKLVWSQLKRYLKDQVFTDLQELIGAVPDQVKYLESDPKLVQSFLNKNEIVFITD